MVTDRLVVDAGAVIRAALVDGFGHWDEYRLFAPSLMWSEAASALAQLRWRHEIDDIESGAALERLLAARIEPVPSADLVRDALVIAADLGWAKSYDAEYVALARRLGAPLITLDARLRAGAGAIVDIRGPTET